MHKFQNFKIVFQTNQTIGIHRFEILSSTASKIGNVKLQDFKNSNYEISEIPGHIFAIFKILDPQIWKHNAFEGFWSFLYSQKLSTRNKGSKNPNLVKVWKVPKMSTVILETISRHA